MLTQLLVYLTVGALAGYLAGLFGVGGGIIIVPVLTTLFRAMGIPPEVIMPLTIGTSMAVVSVTSAFSARTHGSNGNVDWPLARLLAPAVLVGVVAGALLAAAIPRGALVGCVVAFELLVAAMFLLQVWHPDGHGEAPAGPDGAVPKRWPAAPMLAASLPLGLVSSIVGIAGGTLFVPFLTFSGTPMRRAIGTAAALGVPISVAAAAIYVATGLAGQRPLPPGALGFVYLPAFIGCVAGGMWTTKHGVTLAKRMNLRWLKLAFALVLLAAAGKMLSLELAIGGAI